MAKLNFTCPNCAHHKVEVVQDGASATTLINGVDECMDIEYGKTVIHECSQSVYQCVNCGHHICTGTEDDLLDALGYPNNNDKETK